ncbi:ferredoxin, 2fe-2s-like protein [Novymonas esmeraldas]|uniref:Ferredoxin, 2fe-2s-like protein n=1 Tax=Novymonas esmeraldas TaxID=1808958 RepID=A0AAW0F7C8_9TRYP
MWRRVCGLSVVAPLTRVRITTAARLHATPRHYSTPGKVRVRVTTQDGTPIDFDAPAGVSLMHAIRDVAQLEMDGACDGCMQCSTCHVYLSEASFAKLGEPSEQEQDILDKALDLAETSRLACQITLTSTIDGLEVRLPKSVTNLLL